MTNYIVSQGTVIFMLIEYSVENFRSISDKTTLSMLTSKERRKKHNLIKIKGIPGITKLLKSSVLYGANASGKTNQIRALDLIKFIVLTSKNLNKGDKLPYYPFMLSSGYDEEPTYFEIDFISGKKEYRYSFSYNANEIISEELSYFKNKNKIRVYCRKRDQIEVSVDEDELRGLFKHTGDNVLFLSKANNEYKPFGEVFEWFNISLQYIGQTAAIRDDLIIDYMNKSKENKKRVLNILKNADFDIEDVSGEKIKMERSDIPDFILDAIEKDTNKPLKDGEFSKTELKSIHRRDDGSEFISEFEEFESAGTIVFFKMLGVFLDALEGHQRILVMDEFDTRLHPDLIMYLLRIFHDDEYNKSGSQLIVTTHNTRMLSQDFFRREQIWFTEKNKENRNTELYSLFDYEDRVDRSVEKAYLSGRYGGLPDIFYGSI
ncbi:AAA family ATPase [Methanoplanus endosymbiosus]|uniref:ATP-binding protein n=1 Tax=Methanoplanus endosymbiosus TaxID=33865 RepID=A0A9E7PNL5_9EURY|nr:ATP-binding protein [Methanoplanus endosymbiosus]UUX93175.1 ATP-binding protein [Methanoplanus endosymbiosus]